MLDYLMAEGGEDRVVGFIHQTFTSSKYHHVVLVPRYVTVNGKTYTNALSLNGKK